MQDFLGNLQICANVLLVGRPSDFFQVIQRQLQDKEQIYFLIDPLEDLNLLRDEWDFINVILAEYSHLSPQEKECLRSIHHDPELSSIPILCMVKDDQQAQIALEEFADDVLFHHISAIELERRIMNYSRIKEQSRLLKETNSALERKVQERTKALELALGLAKQSEYEISFRLGRASEFRDIETGMHIKRVSHFCALLAELLGLPSEEIDLLKFATPLHDVGKVGIPDQVLMKPGKLTQKEFSVMKAHPGIGAKILENSAQYPVLEAGRVIAYEHHEKWDGTGYPKGKKGENIHIYGRICALADVFDALTSARVYKPPMPLQDAVLIIKEGSEGHFDPQMVGLFLTKLDDFRDIMHTFKDEMDAIQTDHDQYGIDFYDAISVRR